jgi:hypothetical protein
LVSCKTVFFKRKFGVSWMFKRLLHRLWLEPYINRAKKTKSTHIAFIYSIWRHSFQSKHLYSYSCNSFRWFHHLTWRCSQQNLYTQGRPLDLHFTYRLIRITILFFSFLSFSTHVPLISSRFSLSVPVHRCSIKAIRVGHPIIIFSYTT